MNNLRQLIIFNTATKTQRRLLEPSHTYLKTRIWRSTAENPPSHKQMLQPLIPKGLMGQPTCHTHPHMVPAEHLTCGITQAEYRERRDTLVQKLAGESNHELKNHVIVIPAACKQYMSDKIPYVFRQNSDFYYLTGCLEPSAVLVLFKPAMTDNYKSILFVHDKDAHAELWEGPRTGCSNVTALFAVDEARPVEGFSSFLNNMLTKSKPATVWYHGGQPANPEIHSKIKLLCDTEQASVADPQRTLHFMRVFKSPAEVALMRDSCHIGAQAHNMAMACTKPGICESTIGAVLEYSSRQSGAEHLAFPPVIATGANATHIHYIANNQLVGDKDMLLVDSGIQRWLYNSDITRTWPVSGKFSTHHRILYELVLTVQKRLIQLLGEYNPPLDTLFEHMCRLLGRHLQDEGILSKQLDSNELIANAYRLCPHHVSHYLGLDVHDTPLVKRNNPVKPNMIVTVEPGVYISPDDKTVPKEFRGIGIRIEDDVLITDGEPVNLTDACVKEVADIEALIGKYSL